MAQQINLCTTVAVSSRQRFPASTLIVWLAASLALLLAVGGFWLWSLDRSAQTFGLTLESQAKDIQNLKAAIEHSRAAAGPVDPALLREVQDGRALVAQREKLLQFVQQGLFQPGQGHSDRLLLLAHSIPADTWVSSAHADSAVFEVSGFTLDPASLNDWVAQLGKHPLMAGLKLDTVAVSLVADARTAAAKGDTATPPSTVAAPVWSFKLVSVGPAPVTEVPMPGGKP